MADGGLYTRPQRLNTSATAQNKKKPSKFYQNYVFKTIIFIVFAVITLILPSEPPDFVSPSAFFTKSWELFHLIFVGIAVSYGLFSRKNDEFEGEINNSYNNNVKFDSAQSYMSRLLQVTSAFDDEAFDNSSRSHDDDDENDSTMQTWSSKYLRKEPLLVVTENSSVVDNNSGVGGEKPLLLPVRSLKTMVSDDQDGELVGREENYGVPRVYTRSNTSPSVTGVSNNSRRRSGSDVSGLVSGEDYEVNKDYSRSNSSLSSKGYSIESKGMSRSGSVKLRGGISNGDNEVSGSLSRSNSNLGSRGFSSISRRHSGGDRGELDEGVRVEREEKVEETVVLPSPIPWRSRSGRMEMKGESDDSSLHSLPPSLEESEAARLLKPSSSRSPPPSPKELSQPPSVSSPRKQLPSPTVSPEFQARGAEDFGRRKSIYSSRLPPPPPPPPPPPATRRSRLGKSYSSRNEEEKSSSDKELKRRVRSVPTDVGWGSQDEFCNSSNAGVQSIASNGVDCAAIGKSVRTIRTGETRAKEINVPETEVAEMKTSSYNPISEVSEYPKESRDFLEQVLLETDDDSETDGENHEVERVENTKVEEAPSDVDKKADEFIAKFREQIRLQRIESIKRSTGQLKRTSVR